MPVDASISTLGAVDRLAAGDLEKLEYLDGGGAFVDHDPLVIESAGEYWRLAGRWQAIGFGQWSDSVDGAKASAAAAAAVGVAEWDGKPGVSVEGAAMLHKAGDIEPPDSMRYEVSLAYGSLLDLGFSFLQPIYKARALFWVGDYLQSGDGITRAFVLAPTAAAPRMRFRSAETLQTWAAVMLCRAAREEAIYAAKDNAGRRVYAAKKRAAVAKFMARVPGEAALRRWNLWNERAGDEG